MENLIPDDDSIFVDVLEENVSIASNALLEDSFSSTCEPQCLPKRQSTPFKKRPEPRPSGSGTSTGRLQCSQCSNTYANERKLSVHLKMHAMQSASARIPKEADMLDLTREAILKSLKEIQAECCKSGVSLCLSEYCSPVEECIAKGEGEMFIMFLSRCFLNILKKQNVLLPSALRNTVYRLTNQHLNSKDFRQEMNDLSSSMKAANSSVLNLFVGGFGFKVFNWQLILSLRVIRGRSYNDGELRKRYSSDDSHPEEFQQLVYHIGACVLKGILKKSNHYSSNPNWEVYGNIIKMKFLSQPSVPESSDCAAHVKCFTEGKDRGGLTYCNQESFNFFKALFELIMIMSLEGADGSLPLEIVESSVFDNEILIFMWDELVGGEMAEEQSLYHFADIVR